MRIDKIKINEYGVIKNKEIELKDGINIIHGKNESGKSTLLSYINNILYGISKNKDGKDISDYEKYKPWNSNEFSGKISYYLDNGEKYEIFRDFCKKNPQIYNENFEDISNKFSIDKKDGNQFFIEQTGISKQMYLSTVVSMQQEVRLEEKDQNALIQKIANIAGTGEDNVSYKKSMEKLQNKLRDEIGTSNTKQKPINIIQSELGKINEEINKILPYKDRKYEIENEKDKIQNEIKQIEKQREIAEEIQKSLTKQNEIKQRLEINKKEIEENNIKIKNLDNENDGYQIKIEAIAKEIEQLEKNKEILNNQYIDIKNKANNIEVEANFIDEKKPNLIIFSILSIIFIMLIVVGFILNKNNILMIIGFAGTLISIVSYLFTKSKNKRMYLKNIEETKLKNEKEKSLLLEQTNNIEREIDKITKEITNKNEIKNNETYQASMSKGQIMLLESKNNSMSKENKDILSEIEYKNENVISEIRKKYNIEEIELQEIINSEDISEKLRKIDNRLNESKVKLSSITLEENTIIPQVEKLVELEERNTVYKNEFTELIKKANIIRLAMENLEEAYVEMKRNITPKFTENLSETIKKISSNKYSKVIVNDEKGIVVETARGEYIDAGKLSCGTIDQLYLALRLSMIDELATEKMPIMLDETFAYFDDTRMEKVLEYLVKNLNKHQAIIFTCSNREIEILNKLNIKYNNVEL